jgi:hypothetical protein
VETPQVALDDIHFQTVRERLGSNIVITGNIDPVGRIYSGAPKSIREQILNAYDQVKCLKFKVPKVKGTKMTITCFGPVFIGLKMGFPILSSWKSLYG